MRFLALVALTMISGTTLFSQQLVINELSQGPSGSFEYVEFVVSGTATCQNPPPCLDMRGIVFDDNNGYFAAGSGTGIAQGSMRFSSDAFWQCIPLGTIIVIYSESDRNSSIPPDDLSMSDNNGRLIIPANSSLLEKNTAFPTSANSNYPSTGWSSGGQWNTIGMANGGDSFQIRQTISSPTPSHAISWGGNNQNTIIYFAGAAGGLVYSMMNATDNNPSLQANWSSQNASSGETPGVANSTQNAAWITAMSNNTSTTIDLAMSSTNTGCGTNCIGTASVTPTGGATPYSYLWSTGATTQSLSNLCAQTYTVEVTDANGCTATEQVTVSVVNSTLSVSTSATNEVCLGSCSGTASSVITGGVAPFSYLWSNGAISSSISNLCAQTYSVQVTDANGCNASSQTTVGTNPNTMVATTNATNESCANACDGATLVTVSGGTAPYSYIWSNGTTSASNQNLCSGNYSVIATDANGCEVTASQAVQPGASGQSPVVASAGPFESTDAPTQLTASITGGTWTANCTSCITSSGIFNPQGAGVGVHQICYTVGSGACAETTCIMITVTQGCETQFTSENLFACPGKSVVYQGQEISIVGHYDYNYQSVGGCDSIHTVNFDVYTTNPSHDFVTACEGDSVEVNGTWYYETIVANYETTDNNGCILQNTTTITINDCTIDPFSVFIPNTFTPNGDYVNDVFFITINEGMLDNGFIVNRWGQIVRELTATDLTWNGRTQAGMEAPEGVYTYSVVIQKKGGVKEQFQGFITLIR